MKEEKRRHIIDAGALTGDATKSDEKEQGDGPIRFFAFGAPAKGKVSVRYIDIQELLQRIRTMKHLLNGVAIAAVFVVAAPVWAQNPSGGNSVGVPGPNPGGPGLTPYSGGRSPGPKASGNNYIPSGPAGAPPPGAEAAPPPPNSAVPGPHHRHREISAYHHAKAMRNFHRGMAERAGLRGDTTAQLNREELARIQSGNTGNPPAPPPPEGGGAPPPSPSGGNSMGMPGPSTGGPGLTPYSGGAPQR